MKLTKKEAIYNLELTKNEAAALAIIIGRTCLTAFRESVENVSGPYGSGDFGVDVEAIADSSFFFEIYNTMKKELDKSDEIKIQVGQIYKHEDNDEYIVSDTDGYFSLICIGPQNGYKGYSYTGDSAKKIEDIFSDQKKLFTLIK